MCRKSMKMYKKHLTNKYAGDIIDVYLKEQVSFAHKKTMTETK